MRRAGHRRAVILSFVILGTPVPKARVGFDGRSGRKFTTTKTRNYEKRVAAEAFSAARWEMADVEAGYLGSGRELRRRSPAWPLPKQCAKERPLRRGKARARCSCSWCSSTVEVTLGIYLPDKRIRDLDNIEKSILDGMNGVLFRDDRQVRATSKRGHLDRINPRVEVRVELIEPAQAGLGLAEPPEPAAVVCPDCLGTGAFEIATPSGIRRKVACGPCEDRGLIPGPEVLDVGGEP